MSIVEHRAMWMIDGLEENSINATKNGLIKATNIISITMDTIKSFQVGLCAIYREQNSKEVQIQVLQKMSKLCLRSFHKAVSKLKPSIMQSDSYKIAIALKQVILLLVNSKDNKQRTRDVIIKNHIYLILQSIKSDDIICKVLKFAQHHSVYIHFYIFPLSYSQDIDCNFGDIEIFNKIVMENENAILEIYPCTPLGFYQCFLLWIRELLEHDMKEINLIMNNFKLSNSLKSNLNLSGFLFTEHINLKLKFEKGYICPCHGAVLTQDSSNENITITNYKCSVTGASLQLSECNSNANAIKIGNTTLKLPNFSHNYQKLISDNSKSKKELIIISKVKLKEISESLLYGKSFILAPRLNDSINIDNIEVQSNELFCSICRILNKEECAFIALSHVDIETFDQNSLPIHYLITNATDYTCFLIRKIVSCEQVLPLNYVFVPCLQTNNIIEKLIEDNIRNLNDFKEFNALDFIKNGMHDVINSLINESLPLSKHKS